MKHRRPPTETFRFAWARGGFCDLTDNFLSETGGLRDLNRGSLSLNDCLACTDDVARRLFGMRRFW